MTEAELYQVFKGIYLPSHLYTQERLKAFETFSFRPDDIIIATYPKSGTSWMQEIIPLIVSGGDPASVETLPNWSRVPWLEAQDPEMELDARPSPRMFATHVHYNMMPPSFYEVRPKVIFVMRNPKDVFVSSFYYHQMAQFLVDPGPHSQFLQKFLEGKVQYGSWFNHTKSWLNADGKERILFISYEELSTDLQNSVGKIAQFLEKHLADEVKAEIADRCLFKNMKKNNMSNYSQIKSTCMDLKKSEFLRKGITGDWKNLLTAAESEHFDTVYKEELKDVEYQFPWD